MSHHHHSPMILVAGRHQPSRRAITRDLREAGFDVLEGGGEKSLRALINEHRFELIVSVDISEKEGRTLFVSRNQVGTVPVFYLSGSLMHARTDGPSAGPAVPPVELIADIRALLRVTNAEKEIRHLHEIGIRLSTTLNLEATLREVLSAVMEMQQAPMGALSLYNEERSELDPVIGIGLTAEVLHYAAHQPLGVGASETAAAEHRAVVIENVYEEPAYANFLEIAKLAGYCSVYSVPLLTRQDAVQGTITTFWVQPHRPSYCDTHLVELYARLAANAIESVKLYRRLRQEDRNKEEFLAMLAHELRNPMAPILNATHVMRIQAPNNDTLLWAVGMVERQTRHLTHLVDDLLDVSRITRGKIELHRELITLSTIMQNVAESSRTIITDREHEFIVELPEETIWLDADPTRLEQIINNLLHNAAKYTPRGGRIVLGARREASTPDFPRGAAAISVCDTGIGLATEMLHRVFDVFSQAERTLDRAEGGLGLGLTLVRRLTEMHCGKVEALSEGLGRGAEFVVRLPLVPQMPETFEMHSRREHLDETESLFEENRSNGRRVLVVDDQIDTAQSLAELLEIWGHEVRVGYDGPSAVDLAADFHPEVVLLDIGLPLMNGYEVARRLRQMAGHEMTLVAITGYGQDEDRRRAAEAGFDLHLTKPVDLDALRELIGSASRI